MNEHLADLVARYRDRGAIVDTSLLLLFLIGSYRVDLIRRFKRTQRYFPDDFDLLTEFLSEFRQLVVTPHILTEVSNWAMQLPRGSPECLQTLAGLVQTWEERFLEARELTGLPDFPDLGLTDAGIGRLAMGTYLVVTDDLPLFARLQSRGIDAVNFTHLRAPSAES